MNSKEREEFSRDFLERYCLDVMKVKGRSYSRGEEDSLSNFKRVADDLGLTPIQVAYTYLSKHMDAVAYWAKTGEESSEGINTNIGDAINYLLILLLLEQERKQVSEYQKLEVGEITYSKPQPGMIINGGPL